MSTFLQFAIPFATALLLLGLFNLLAYIHIQLSEVDQTEDEMDRAPVVRS